MAWLSDPTAARSCHCSIWVGGRAVKKCDNYLFYIIGWLLCNLVLKSLKSRTAGGHQVPTDRGHELIDVEGLVNDAVGAEFLRDGEEIGLADPAAARHRDDLHPWPLAAHRHDGADAVLLGHENVGQHDRRRDPPEGVEPLEPVARRGDGDAIGLEHAYQRVKQRRIFFDREHGGGAARHRSRWPGILPLHVVRHRPTPIVATRPAHIIDLAPLPLRAPRNTPTRLTPGYPSTVWLRKADSQEPGSIDRACGRP